MELWKYGAIVLTAIESARSFYINVGYERNEALLKDGGISTICTLCSILLYIWFCWKVFSNQDSNVIDEGDYHHSNAQHSVYKRFSKPEWTGANWDSRLAKMKVNKANYGPKIVIFRNYIQ